MVIGYDSSLSEAVPAATENRAAADKIIAASSECLLWRRRHYGMRSSTEIFMCSLSLPSLSELARLTS